MTANTRSINIKGLVSNNTSKSKFFATTPSSDDSSSEDTTTLLATQKKNGDKKDIDDLFINEGELSSRTKGFQQTPGSLDTFASHNGALVYKGKCYRFIL